jgi:hypothetical protein
VAVSRRDFQAIADGLKRTRPEGHGTQVTTATWDQWRHDRDAVAAALHDVAGLNNNGNRRFDIDRFREWTEA